MNTCKLSPGLLLAFFLPLHLAVMGINACSSGDVDGDGYTTEQGDCDDGNPTTYPGAIEVCDGLDNNCDGLVDEGATAGPWYADFDGDGYGDPATTSTACSAPAGYVATGGDCDDTVASVHPGASGDECTDRRDYNCDGEVGIIVPDGGSLAIDIPAVAFTVTATLGGKALSSTNTNANDYGGIELEDTATGKRFPLFDLWNPVTGQPVSSFAAQVLPGTYDIYYAVRADGANWPDNERAALKRGVTFTAGQTLALDIPVVAISFTTTLNGQALTTSNTSMSDYGAIRLRDTASGDAFDLYALWNTTNMTPRASYTAQLIPGTYDILYTSVNSGSRWPANVDALIRGSVALTAPSSQTVNIATVSTTLNLTLNGQAVSSANTSADDEGEIDFVDTTAGKKFKVLTTWDDALGTLAASTYPLIPGTYDILYSVKDDGPHWPANVDRVLKSSVAISTAQSIALPISTVNLTVNLTLGGQAVSTANTNAEDEGEINLRDAANGETFLFFSAYDDAAGAVRSSFTGQVMPGTYDVVYGIHDNGPTWPDNENATLKSGLALSAAQTLAVDVPVATLSLNVTLDGQAISTSNTSSLDYGRILLRSADGDRFLVVDLWNLTAATLQALPYAARVLPGTYDVYYDVVEDGSSWPANEGSMLKAGVAVSTSQSLVVDIPLSSVTMTVTLNGQALTSANTSATDEGSIDLLDFATDSVIDGFSAFNDTSGTITGSHVVKVIPGSYLQLYTVQDDGPSWPSSDERPLGCFTLR